MKAREPYNQWHRKMAIPITQHHPTLWLDHGFQTIIFSAFQTTNLTHKRVGCFGVCFLALHLFCLFFTKDPLWIRLHDGQELRAGQREISVRVHGSLGSQHGTPRGLTENRQTSGCHTEMYQQKLKTARTVSSSETPKSSLFV